VGEPSRTCGLREWRRVEDREEVVSEDVGIDGSEEEWR
jgi:hypothetical protein